MDEEPTLESQVFRSPILSSIVPRTVAMPSAALALSVERLG
jgi:hypothetical protein